MGNHRIDLAALLIANESKVEVVEGVIFNYDRNKLERGEEIELAKKPIYKTGEKKSNVARSN